MNQVQSTSIQTDHEQHAYPIRLHCGDYQERLQHVSAQLIVTSPPYNIGSTSPRRDGFRRFGKYDPKSFGAIRDYPDHLPEEVYQDQQRHFLLWCADHLTPHGVLVYNHKPRRKSRAMIHPAQWFLAPEITARLTLMEEIIWHRGSTHNHCPNLMWPTTERLYVFRQTNGIYPLRNHHGLSFRTDCWQVGRAPVGPHTAAFPVELASAILQTWSQPGALVCDPYMGSGTTALAAFQLRRCFEGAEILLKYYRHARERLAKAQKERA